MIFLLNYIIDFWKLNKTFFNKNKILRKRFKDENLLWSLMIVCQKKLKEKKEN